MKRLRIIIVVLTIGLLLAVLCLLGLLRMARAYPETGAGLAMFHIGYERTADKMQFLLNYQNHLHGNGRIPPPVDRFLVGRLAVIAPESDEWAAIVKFYRRADISAWGCLGGINDNLKKILITQWIASLDDEMPVVQDLEPTILQIEFLRRDGKLSKPSVTGLDISERQRLAAHAFKLWWGNGDTWPENKVANPLEGTGVTVVEQ